MTLRDEIATGLEDESGNVAALTAALLVAAGVSGPRITQWARTQATRIAQILSTPPTLPAAVITADIPARLLVRHQRNLVGLTDGHAAAVDRLFRSSIADGVDPQFALKVAEWKATQLLRWRTDTIAITERTRAVNMGRQLTWQEAIDEGRLSRDAVKVWRTRQDARVDPTCNALDGVVVAVAGDFKVENAAVVPFTTRTPPAHARCRCFLELA